MNFHHKSNTNKKFQAHEIFEEIERADLIPESEFSLFSHIGELISNVYHHAISDSYINVDWSLNIKKSYNKIFITVADNGRGIEESLKEKNINCAEDQVLIELAVEKTVGNRGLGLKTIYDLVNQGELHSFKIQSGLDCYSLDSTNKNIDKLSSNYQGVKAQLVVMLGDVS